MSVQQSTNYPIFDTFRTNPGNKPQKPTGLNSIPSTPRDTVSFGGIMNENLKYSEDKSIGGMVFDGTLNDKQTTIKRITPEETKAFVEGTINGKKIQFKREDNIYIGTYGGKEFNLKTCYNKPNKILNKMHELFKGEYFTPDFFDIEGKIGNNEIQISMPNCKIPKDEDTKDILSTILFLNGLEPRTYNGDIVQVAPSNMSKGLFKHRSDKRDKVINDDIKPVLVGAISSAATILLTTLVNKI